MILDDSTQLLATLRVSDILGTVRMLYSLLLHSDAPNRHDSATQEAGCSKLSDIVIHLATNVMVLLQNVALLDLNTMQVDNTNHIRPADI